ncbi:uncharacterized protein NPIL_525321 [Nephila pilipes]|uniref:Uncharacterized protein n=1 Tax=Nephila pilipes TaxID=299642 RepID=A0A8X6NME0_NEPPI|nr:uncharacterized protein NPIL_525321 [Nephila pilipes]
MVIYSHHRGSRGATLKRIAIVMRGGGSSNANFEPFPPGEDGLHFPGQPRDKGLLSITESETADKHWVGRAEDIIGRLLASMQIGKRDSFWAEK